MCLFRPICVFHTMTWAMIRVVTVARARPTLEAPGSPGAALHRSVLQHVLVMLYTVVELLLGKVTSLVLLQLATAKQPFFVIFTKPAAEECQIHMTMVNPNPTVNYTIYLYNCECFCAFWIMLASDVSFTCLPDTAEAVLPFFTSDF